MSQAVTLVLVRLGQDELPGHSGIHVITRFQARAAKQDTVSKPKMEKEEEEEI